MPIRQQQIQNIARSRALKHVLHFTRLDNLNSILTSGLLPRSELAARHIAFSYNDELRLDGASTASCMSISWPNYKMLYKYKKAFPNSAWVVVSLKTSVLWEYDCAFCFENAASNRVKEATLQERRKVSAFESMFDDHNFYPPRKTLQIPDHFPTNPQAEVLLFGNVPTSMIQSIYIETDVIYRRIRNMVGTIPAKVTPKVFTPRFDWKHWKPTSNVVDDMDIQFLG